MKKLMLLFCFILMASTSFAEMKLRSSLELGVEKTESKEELSYVIDPKINLAYSIFSLDSKTTFKYNDDYTLSTSHIKPRIKVKVGKGFYLVGEYDYRKWEKSGRQVEEYRLGIGYSKSVKFKGVHIVTHLYGHLYEKYSDGRLESFIRMKYKNAFIQNHWYADLDDKKTTYNKVKIGYEFTKNMYLAAYQTRITDRKYTYGSAIGIKF